MNWQSRRVVLRDLLSNDSSLSAALQHSRVAFTFGLTFLKLNEFNREDHLITLRKYERIVAELAARNVAAVASKLIAVPEGHLANCSYAHSHSLLATPSYSKPLVPWTTFALYLKKLLADNLNKSPDEIRIMFEETSEHARGAKGWLEYSVKGYRCVGEASREIATIDLSSNGRIFVEEDDMEEDWHASVKEADYDNAYRVIASVWLFHDSQHQYSKSKEVEYLEKADKAVSLKDEEYEVSDFLLQIRREIRNYESEVKAFEEWENFCENKEAIKAKYNQNRVRTENKPSVGTAILKPSKQIVCKRAKYTVFRQLSSKAPEKQRKNMGFVRVAPVQVKKPAKTAKNRGFSRSIVTNTRTRLCHPYNPLKQRKTEALRVPYPTVQVLKKRPLVRVERKRPIRPPPS